MEEKQKIIDEVKNLCRKADQTRSIHNMMRDKIALLSKIFLLYVTIGSAITAMLIFAAIPSVYVIWVGIFSASIFIISIIPGALNFDLKILERAGAVQVWGDWIRDASDLCNTTNLTKIDIDSLNTKKDQLMLSYKKAMEKTPLIPDSKFNKYKRLHLQKVEISKALDKNPFKTIKEIKKSLK